MNKEDYVNYDVAKLLKEKGYDKPCRYYYTNGEFSDSCSVMNHNYSKREFGLCSAPFLWDVQKWFREEHALSVEPKNVGFEDEWECYIMNIVTGKISQCAEHIETYEEALNEGIKEALKFIK